MTCQSLLTRPAARTSVTGPNSRLLLAALLATGSSNLLAQDAPSKFSASAAVETRFDSNIALAPDNNSEREDLSTRVSFSGIITPVRSAKQDLSISVTPFYEGVADLSDLSRYGVGAAVKFRQQFSNSFTSPYVRVEATADWQTFDNSEPRDGFRGNADVVLGKQFSPKIGVELGYRYRFQRSTNNSPEGSATPDSLGRLSVRGANSVFDTDNHGGFVKLLLEPVPRWSASLEYNYMTGEVSASSNILEFANPELFDTVRDFALEEGTNFQAYRIDADQHIISVGGQFAATDKLTVDLGVSYLDASGEQNNDYTNVVATLAGRWRF